jgi:hypothetical protein
MEPAIFSSNLRIDKVALVHDNLAFLRLLPTLLSLEGKATTMAIMTYKPPNWLRYIGRLDAQTGVFTIGSW